MSRDSRDYPSGILLTRRSRISSSLSYARSSSCLGFSPTPVILGGSYRGSLEGVPIVSRASARYGSRVSRDLGILTRGTRRIDLLSLSFL